MSEGNGNVVTIIPHINGPLEVLGPIRVRTESGQVIECDAGENWLCRCGGSKNKPFCDGTHRKIGFQAPDPVPPPAAAATAAGAAPEGFVRVAALADVPAGEALGVEVAGRPVVLCRVDGEVCALGGICSHQNASLAGGEVEGTTLWCPLHASGFDVRTGEANQPPATRPIPTYAVRVVDGQVLVAVT